MALDVPCVPPLYRLPLGIYGEFFLLSRPGIAGLFESPEAGRVEGTNGTIFVTSIRLCFIPDRIGVGGARPFDVPLQGIIKEEFKQPFFGANYLCGLVSPVPGRGLVNNCSFRFTFNEGGCQTFLRVFFTLMAQYRIPRGVAPSGFFDPPRLQSWVQAEDAVRDPQDPSVIYLSQPMHVSRPQQPQQYAPVPSSDADERQVSYQSIAEEEAAQTAHVQQQQQLGQQQQQRQQQPVAFAPMPVSTSSSTNRGSWTLPFRSIL
jgi:hypothetical protein